MIGKWTLMVCWWVMNEKGVHHTTDVTSEHILWTSHSSLFVPVRREILITAIRPNWKLDVAWQGQRRTFSVTPHSFNLFAPHHHKGKSRCPTPPPPRRPVYIPKSPWIYLSWGWGWGVGALSEYIVAPNRDCVLTKGRVKKSKRERTDFAKPVWTEWLTNTYVKSAECAYLRNP